MKHPDTHIQLIFQALAGKRTFLIELPKQVVAAFRKMTSTERAKIADSALDSQRDKHKKNIAAIKSRPLKPMSLLFSASRRFQPDLDEISGPFLDRLICMEEAWNNPEIKNEVLKIATHVDQIGGLSQKDFAALLIQACAIAIRHDDRDFFKSLGRKLESRHPRIEFDAEFSNPICDFLANHWLGRKPSDIHLCCFTDQAATDFLKITTSFSASEAAVRKARQRLGLRRFRTRLIRTIKRQGDVITLN